jgi:hypothetical protein
LQAVRDRPEEACGVLTVYLPVVDDDLHMRRTGRRVADPEVGLCVAQIGADTEGHVPSPYPSKAFKSSFVVAALMQINDGLPQPSDQCSERDWTFGSLDEPPRPQHRALRR